MGKFKNKIYLYDQLDKKSEFIDLYFNKEYSFNDLVKHFNTCFGMIQQCFKVWKIKARDRQWKHKKYPKLIADSHRKYSLNRNFFKIPTILNSYWAGFIASDGCIYSRDKQGKSLVITIAQKDIRILKRFKRDLKYNGEIKKYEYMTSYGLSKSCRLSIHNPDIVDDLQKNWNITTRKTFTLLPNKKIKNFKLFFSFLMGYIDGDGCFTYFGAKKKYLTIRINGTKKLLQWFKKMLTKHFNDDFGIIYPEKSIYVLSIHKINHLKLIYQISKNIPIQKMNRKWNILKYHLK